MNSRLLWATALAAVWIAPTRSSEPQGVVVWQHGQDGYHTYRIPALVATRKKTLLAFAEGRRSGSGDSGDIDALVKRSADGGLTWSAAITVADFGPDTVGNPAPVVDRRTGTVWLLLTSNSGRSTEKEIIAGTAAARTVWVTHSRDDGRTWARPLEITSATKDPSWTWYATGPGNGIQTKRGRMIVACDHNRGAARYSHIVYSDDHGRSWKLGGTAGPDCNESTIAERRDGSLLLNMRSYHGQNRRAASISSDGGETWTEPKLDSALIEPVCQASLLRFGAALLFSNPADITRRNMTVRMSRDGGLTWPVSRTIWPGPAAYSNLVELPGRAIGLLYERGDASPYETISFVRFSRAWLLVEDQRAVGRNRQ